MLKLLLYISLFSVGGYYAAGYIPDSVKGKFLSAIGFSELRDKGYKIINPAAKRADILQKLETNISKLEQIQSGPSGNSVDSPKNAGINIKGDPIKQDEADAVIAESKALLEEMKELNPKTGIVTGVVGKIFKVGSDSQQQAITADQITPEIKEQICK